MFEQDKYLWECYLDNQIPHEIKDENPDNEKEGSEEKVIAPMIMQNQAVIVMLERTK